MTSASNLANLADHYWDTRTRRLAADNIAAAFKVTENQAEATLVAEMRAQGLTAIGGSLVRLALPVEPAYEPAVEDWTLLYKHILAHEDFSLLEKRIGRASVKERWAANITVPGVTRFPVFKLSKSEVK